MEQRNKIIVFAGSHNVKGFLCFNITQNVNRLGCWSWSASVLHQSQLQGHWETPLAQWHWEYKRITHRSPASSSSKLEIRPQYWEWHLFHVCRQCLPKGSCLQALCLLSGYFGNNHVEELGPRELIPPRECRTICNYTSLILESNLIQCYTCKTLYWIMKYWDLSKRDTVSRTGLTDNTENRNVQFPWHCKIEHSY